MEGVSDVGTDASSIKPVSSLRSKYERLGRDSDSQRHVNSPVNEALLHDFGGPISTSPGSNGGRKPLQGGMRNGQRLPFPRESSLNPARPRPHSMIVTSTSHTMPPRVKIDPAQSPSSKPASQKALFAQSPHKSDTGPNQSTSLSQVLKLPPSVSSREVNRPLSPVPRNTHPPLVRSSNNQKAQSDGVITSQHTPQLSPTLVATRPDAGLSAVNKPSVPKKPAGLMNKSTSLAVTEPSVVAADHSISPFSTPSNSGSSSPTSTNMKHTLPQHSQDHPDDRMMSRLRGASDASFVEHLSDTPDGSPTVPVRNGFRRSPPPSIAPRRTRKTSPNRPGVAPKHILPRPPSHGVEKFDEMVKEPSYEAQPHWIARMKGINIPGDLPGHRPPLPSRTQPNSRSGRTSPVGGTYGNTGSSNGSRLQRAATTDDVATHRIPASKSVQGSALMQGFDRTTHGPASKPTLVPVAPTPRRSIDRRREAPSPVNANASLLEGETNIPAVEVVPTSSTAVPTLVEYPDSTQSSRRPPSYKHKPHHIRTECDARTFAVCGRYVCTTGHQTKAWDLSTGEQIMYMNHDEAVKMTSMVFKPAQKVEDEGKRIWLGSNFGEILEVDIPTQSVVKTRPNAHQRKEITRMFRHASQLWTLDDSGEVNVWGSGDGGPISVDSQCATFRAPRGHTFSIGVGSHLWYATGKQVWILAPGARSESEFYVLRNALSQDGTGEIVSGATLSSKPDSVYFGHQDGKVSIYNRKDFTCSGVVNVSLYKLSSLAGVGDFLWAGFHTGMIYVFDPSTNPWKVKKDWKAHDKHICGIFADRSTVWKLDRLHVVTLGIDNNLKIWDGTLEADWLDSRMHERDSEYCSFRELTAAVLTWNAGATKPHYLQQRQEDDQFFRDYIASSHEPDFFCFGFQELVDLEDKKTTAKAFFKSRLKDTGESEHMGHQYRAWRDYLTRCLDDITPLAQTYTILHTSSLVGLFTCIFVKSALRSRIKHVHAAEVKRGLGGIHGNKGALILRIVLDDTSICFINCHLAAGQTQTMSRNHDVTEILESEALPAYPLGQDSVAQHSDVFASGGDGSMIMDHEICILSGDLNYRIDTMGRETIIKHIAQNNFSRLLERDQLLLSRRKNAGNRLRAFQESEITFAPTYKYDPRSDRYDTSEKRRAPAWCDRILYRGLGKVKMEEYRRWEFRVSDHRPVSGRLRLRVKTVDATHRDQLWEVCQQDFEKVRKRIAHDVQIEYLTNVLGLSQNEAASALKT